MTRRIFVGGTGRSGTTVTARLMGSHPDLETIRYEVRFHAAVGGIGDLLEGRTELGIFLSRMRETWYRGRPDGSGGLHRLIPEETFEHALERFSGRFASEPSDAARDLICDLLDPFAAESSGWVEHSPETVLSAGVLGELLPDALLVHCVRDGRDVASSMSAQPWGPADPVEAVRWWGWRMVWAARETASWPDERHLVLRFEDLFDDRRDECYFGLLRFAGLSESTTTRGYLETELRHDHLHQGRWKDEPQASEIDLAYRAARERLRRHPLARHLDAVLGPAEETEPDVLAPALHRQLVYEATSETTRLRKARSRLRRHSTD
jgi:hypothetical protein